MTWRIRDQPPGRRRVTRALVAYAIVLLALVALDLAPSPLLLAAFFLVGTAVAGFAANQVIEIQRAGWASSGQSTLGLGRGGDHRTVALARRLAHRDRDPAQRRSLAIDIQKQLRAVLADRVRREHGWDILANPELAYEALPTDLADLVARPADLRLVDPRHLSAVLDRIESP